MIKHVSLAVRWLCYGAIVYYAAQSLGWPMTLVLIAVEVSVAVVARLGAGG